VANFFFGKYAPFIFRIGENFNIDGERVEIGEVHFYNTFEHLWFRKFLVFDNIFLTKNKFICM